MKNYWRQEKTQLSFRGKEYEYLKLCEVSYENVKYTLVSDIMYYDNIKK